MKVDHIRKEVIYHMVVDGESYKRYSADGWVKTMYFDLISEDYEVIPEDCVKLENLFIDYMLEEDRKDNEAKKFLD